MKKHIAILLILALFAASGCIHVSTAAPDQKAEATDAPVTAAPTAKPAPLSTADPNVQYAFTFSAKTLDGETMTEEVFGRYDLTMVNVWASWCPPCRGELSELGELYGRLPENVGFLSVTVDDPGDLADAKALLQENGCAFPCLDGQTSPGLMNGFIYRVMAIPTTIFFDRTGEEVGEWIIGVPQGSASVADAYMAEIQARLDMLGK